MKITTIDTPSRTQASAPAEDLFQAFQAFDALDAGASANSVLAAADAKAAEAVDAAAKDVGVLDMALRFASDGRVTVQEWNQLHEAYLAVGDASRGNVIRGLSTDYPFLANALKLSDYGQMPDLNGNGRSPS